MPSNCKIIRDPKTNAIQDVRKEGGQQSRLFIDIASHPLVGSKEDALELYKNVFSKKVQKQTVGEDNVRVSHKNGDNIYTSYKEAVKNTPENGEIEVGLETGGKFFPLIKTTNIANRDTQTGFINHAIKNNLLKDRKKQVSNGEYRFESAGETDIFQTINSELLEEDARLYLGTEGVGRDGDTFLLQKTNDKVRIQRGEKTEYVDSEYLNTAPFPEVKNKYGEDVAIGAVTGREWAKALNGKRLQEERARPRTEQQLQLLLMDLLNKLGVSTTSIVEYNTKYAKRNGTNPSARALADIANQVIAFEGGEITLEDLTEETTHFINEALPQEKIENLLRNVHRTREWAQYSQVYREIYRDDYQGEELEQAVRREVLGKVLKNALLNRFQAQEGQSETQTNIINRLQTLFNEFFQKVKDYFKPQYQKDLETYKNEIEDILFMEDVSNVLDTDNFKDNRFRLYAISNNPQTEQERATERIRKAVQVSARQIREQILRAYRATGDTSNLERAELNKLEEELERNEELEAITGLISLTNSYIRRMDAAIGEADKTPFTTEQNIVYHSLKGVLTKALAEIKQLAPQMDYNKETVAKISKDIDTIGQKMTDLEAKKKLHVTDAVDNLVQQVMDRHNLPEEYRERVQNWIKTAEHDTTFFHQNFGQIIHSRDPILALLGVKAKDIEQERNQDTTNSLQNALKRFREIGYNVRNMGRDFVDKKSGNIISEYDWERFNADLDNIFLEEYKKVAPKSDYQTTDKKGNTKQMSDEDILKERRNLEQKLSPENKGELNRQIKKRKQPLVERRMNDAYYDKFEKRIEDSGVSEVGIGYIMAYYSDISSLNRKATKDGVIDLRNLDEYDRQKYEDFLADKKFKKSYYDEVGNLKKGLKVDANGDVVIDPAQTLSQDAQIAVDLNKFEGDFIKTVEQFTEQYKINNNGQDPSQKEIDDFMASKDRRISPKFFDMLQKAFEVSPEEGMRFLKLNSYMGFSDQFWNDLQQNQSLREKITAPEVYTGDNMAEVDAILETLDTKGKALKAILKQFQHKNNPSEIDVQRMPSVTRDAVKKLQEDITNAYRKASKLIEEQTGETFSDVDTETTTNESYRKILIDLGLNIEENDSAQEINRKLDEQVEYARQHMTADNAKGLSDAIYFLNRYLEGKTGEKTNKAIDSVLDENGWEMQDLEDIRVKQQVVEQLITRRLLPYYKRFAPSQYGVFLQAMQDPNVPAKNKVESIKQGTYNYIEIAPNTSFLEIGGVDDLNPNFIPEFYGGYDQPKLSKYYNKDFEKIKNDPKLYEAYKATLEWNSEGLDAMQIGGTYNRYTMPQFRKGTIQRAKDLTKNLSAQSIKEAWTEAITFTPDELIQGETQFGNSIKVIPNIGTNRLENQEDVSDDLFWSIAARNSEGFLKRARLNAYGDIMALSDAIDKRTTGNGKEVTATNTYKMFQNFMDYTLFGVKETWTYEVDVPFLGKVDVAKVVRNIVKYVKFRNLGLNAIIPITSAITGKVQLLIESLVGEHIGRDSLKLGRRALTKLMPEAMGDFNKLGKKSKLNVILQHFRAFSALESLQNSNYSGAARFLPKISMGLHELANFPLYGEVALGTLFDYRVVDGSIINRNNFNDLNKGKTKKEIDSLWRAQEENAFYNFIDVNDGILSFDEQKLKTLLTDTDGNPMSDERFKQYLDNKVKGIQTRMGEIILNVDTQIPTETRVAAQRNALFSILLTHRSFLITNISRRTRSEFYNPMTGELEEGTYRSAANFLNASVQELRKMGTANFIRAFKEQWKNSSVAERRNLKRVAVDISVLTLMAAIGYLIVGAADDDEEGEQYALQAVAYFYQRLLNETSSVQKIGMVTSVNDTLESPIIGLNIVQNIFKAQDLFSGDIIKQGSYKGSTERFRYLSKMMAGVSQYNYLNSGRALKTARHQYEYFNSSNLKATPFSFIVDRLENKEE
jgi:hypothetical protein